MPKAKQKYMFSVVLIGAGNVGTHLAVQLKKRKHQLLQIISHSEESGAILSKKVQTPFTTDLKKINTKADIYIICTPDNAIEKVANQLPLTKKIILHTSGSTDINALKNVSENRGVLYPLQSLSKDIKTPFYSVPLLIEGSNTRTLQKIKQLAASLSKTVIESSSQHRQKLHLAATIVNNFGNYLLALSHQFLEKEKITDFHLLTPLIKQTCKKASKKNPFETQTGAARRGDTKTIDKHLLLLKKHPTQKKVYELFTQLIKQYYER